jgi:hypothetical protein
MAGYIFGIDVRDVDVLRANDSLGGDDEWLAFNVSDDDMPAESADFFIHQELHETKTQSKAIQLRHEDAQRHISSKLKELQSKSKTIKLQYQDAQRHILLFQIELQFKLKGKKSKSSTDDVKDDKERRRSKSNNSSSKKMSERSKKSSSSSSPSKSKRDKTTKSTSLRGFWDTEDDEDGVPGHESSSVSTATSEEFQGYSRHRVPIFPRASPRAAVDSAKPRPKGSDHLPSGSILSRSRRDLLNGSNHRSRVDSPSTTGDWNLEEGAPSSPNNLRAKYAPRRKSSTSNHLPSRSNHGTKSRDLPDGSNHRAQSHSPSTSRDCNLKGVPGGPDRPQRAASDDVLASPYRTSERSMSSPRTELVRQRDGNVQPRRYGDRARRNSQSKNRRESVKDSLFKFLYDDAPLAPYY